MRQPNKRKIAEDFSKGTSVYKLSKEHHIGQMWVKEILREQGIEPNQRVISQIKKSTKTKQTVENIADYAAKVHTKENFYRIIGELKRLGTSPEMENDALRKIMKENKIENPWYLTNSDLEYIREKMKL